MRVACGCAAFGGWSIVDWNYTGDGEWCSVDDNIDILDISDDNNGILR